MDFCLTRACVSYFWLIWFGCLNLGLEVCGGCDYVSCLLVRFGVWVDFWVPVWLLRLLACCVGFADSVGVVCFELFVLWVVGWLYLVCVCCGCLR